MKTRGAEKNGRWTPLNVFTAVILERLLSQAPSGVTPAITTFTVVKYSM